LEHGAILLAVGGREARPQCHGYGELPAVITQREWAEKTHNKEWDPAALRTVVMIQCAGSREEPRNYCSRVCCAVSLKYALDLKSQNPEARVVVLYRDIMAYGFLETYYTQARKAGVLFIPYEVDRKPVVEAGDSGAVVTAYDPIARLDLRIDANVVILAAGMDSGLDDGLARVFGVDRNQDGFFRPVDPKWRPMEALREGVFACGAALGPRNVAETTASAEAAAMRVLEILNRPRLALARVSAHVRPAYCSLCERCVEACPFQARSVDEDLEVIVINPALCQGCGLCAAVCPNGAAVVAGYTQTSLLAEVDAAVEGAWA
jgi:heterodisulfide reductase subunit A